LIVVELHIGNFFIQHELTFFAYLLHCVQLPKIFEVLNAVVCTGLARIFGTEWTMLFLVIYTTLRSQLHVYKINLKKYMAVH